MQRGCITWCRGEAFAQRRPFVGDVPSNGLLVLRTLSRPVLLWLVRDDALRDPLRSSPCCCFHISGIPRLFPQGAWPGNTKGRPAGTGGNGGLSVQSPGERTGALTGVSCATRGTVALWARTACSPVGQRIPTTALHNRINSDTGG